MAAENSNTKNNNNNHLLIRSVEGIYQVQIDDVVFLEADCSYTTVFLSNGKQILSSSNLGKISSLLQDHEYIRISRKHLVNRKYITFYHSKEKYIKLETPDKEYQLDVSLKVNDIKQLLST